MVCLIKPQFEAGREKVGKKGVVRDKAVHEEVIQHGHRPTREVSAFEVKNLEFSPIKGPEGNIEYLLHIKKQPEGFVQTEFPVDVTAVVEEAHKTLDR